MRTVPIVVVDDGSSDETAKQLAARFGEHVAVRRLNENKGFATACNFAADFVDTEWTVFLNNDTVAFPGWLDNMFAYQRQHPSAAALGARLLYPDGTAQHAGVVFGSDSLPYHAYHGFPGEHPAVMQLRRLQAVTGACLLIRTDLFRDIGGFDAAYRNGYEDIDLCLPRGRHRSRGPLLPSGRFGARRISGAQDSHPRTTRRTSICSCNAGLTPLSTTI